MNKDSIKEHEYQRKKLWCDACVAYVASSNSTEKLGGISWADAALKAFDDRFKAPVSLTEANN